MRLHEASKMKDLLSVLYVSIPTGLARYAHYINVDFIQDIVYALRNMIGDSSLPMPTQLQCAVSALELLQQVS